MYFVERSLVDRGKNERGVERGVEGSHLRFLRREELRWQRGNVITVAEGLFLIPEWGIVRRLVQLHAKS